MKFEKFLNDVFKSKKPAVDVKDEIVKYVQALETNYNEVIRSFKDLIDKEKSLQRKTQSETTNARMERNDLE